MPNWLKFTLVALAAFALGFFAAGPFTAVDASMTEDLAWELDGEAVQFTANAPGASYLIVTEGTESQSLASGVVLSLESAKKVKAERFPVSVYKLVPLLGFSGPSRSSKCIGCVPPPRVPGGGPRPVLEARLWDPSH